MSQDSTLKVAENSKQLAENYARENNFGRAFAHYLVALKLQPDWRPALKEEFSTVLCQWGMILDNAKRFTDLFNCYEQAVQIFPDNEILLNNLGAHLLRCGLLKEAAHYFRCSLNVKANFIRAFHNLENVSNLAVERWHFRMLNDNYRNEAFREAILKKIKQGFDRVLDIGTGTGILSLFCVEGKAKEIYACDSSSIMTDIAHQVFQKNGATEIKLLNKHSTDLSLPIDIPKRVSLVVTETFDSGLLGEGILSTILDAWERLLVPDNGFVVPSGATLYICGVESDMIASEVYLKDSEIPTEFEGIIKNCNDYDTKNLKHIPFKCLTDVQKILNVNFNNPNLVKQVLNGHHDKKIELKCTKSGRLDCFAVWFELVMDEDIVLSTSPESELNNAWDQAIFFIPKYQYVKEKQEIAVDVSFKNGKVSVKFSEHKGLQPSEDIIRTLNDKLLVEELNRASHKLSTDFDHPVQILDTFPFPIFGLEFLKKREKRFKDKLFCVVPLKMDQDFVRFIAQQQKIEDSVLILTDSDSEEFSKKKLEFDIIAMNWIETTGELKEKTISRIQYFRSILKPDGVLLPQNVSILGQLIHSHSLQKMSQVINSEVTCGYEIGNFINVYQTNHYIDIDSKATEMTFLSEPFKLYELYSPEEDTQNSVSILSKNGHPNAIIYWFKLKLLEGFEEYDTKDEYSMWHQAAFLFFNIKPCDIVRFNVIRDNGLFCIKLDQS